MKPPPGLDPERRQDSNPKANRKDSAMTDKIDVPQVLEDLQAVVAEKGDGYRYTDDHDEGEGCVYRNGDGSPACIVGYVLHRRGLLDCVSAFQNDAGVNGVDVARDEFDNAARRVLQKAQDVQDEGAPWGTALIAAKDLAAKFAAEDYGL